MSIVNAALINLFKNAPLEDAIVMTDEENRVVFWNAGAENLFDIPSETIMKKPFMIEFQASRLKVIGNQTVKKSDHYTYRTRFITDSGKTLYLRISASQQVDSEGYVTGHFYVMNDIFKEVIEERLRLAIIEIAQISSRRQSLIVMLEKMMKTIQSHLELPMVYISITEDNERYFAAQSRLTPEELLLEKSTVINSQFETSIPSKKSRMYHIASLSSDMIANVTSYCVVRTSLSQDRGINGIIHFVVPEGLKKAYCEDKVLSLIAKKVSSSILTRQLEDEIKHYTQNLEIIVKKRTQELRDKDAQIIQAEKLATLGEMATGVAHEINQPLGGISLITQGLMKALKKGKLSDDMLEDRLSSINEQIDRITKIINHLRVFGRQAPETKTRVDINKPLLDVFELAGEQLKKRNIKIQMDLDERLPCVFADHNRLEQVFLNIISNARDALDEQEAKVHYLLSRPNPPAWAYNWEKSIMINSYRTENNVAVSITDTAGGIPDNIKNKIFEPFFTTKDVGKGTGLGLSISYGIIKEFGGEFKSHSKLNEGSTFIVMLPCMEDKTAHGD